MESYKLLMGELKVDDSLNNKFVYESSETCVVPSRDTGSGQTTQKPPTTGSQGGANGPQGGANGPQGGANSPHGGANGPQVGASTQQTGANSQQVGATGAGTH